MRNLRAQLGRFASPGWVLAAFGVGALLLFHRVLPPEQAFLERDMHRVYLPAKAFWAEQVKRGELPGWYPYDGLGQPFAGAVVTGAYHPGNLLFLVLDPVNALELLVLLCFPLAGLGAWLSFRARGVTPLGSGVAAVTYAFSGYLVSMTANFAYLHAAALLPWVVWAAERLRASASFSSAPILGAALALMVLGGEPQAFAVSAGTAVILALIERPAEGGSRQRVAGVLAAALVLAAMLGSLQLTAAWSALQESFAERRTLNDAVTWSVHPLRLFEALVGNVFGLSSPRAGELAGMLSLQADGFWAPSLYLGLPALALAAIGVRARWRDRSTQVAIALLLVFLLLALGKHTPLYGLVYEAIPLWRAFRYPEKLFPHVAYWLSALAALGVDVLASRGPSERRGGAWLVLVAGAACLGLAVASESVVGTLRPLFAGADAAWSELAEVLNDRLRFAGWGSAGVCLALGAVWWRARSREVVGAATLILSALGTGLFGSQAYSAIPTTLVEAKPRLLEAMEAHAGGPLDGRARVYNAARSLALPSGEALSHEALAVAGGVGGLLPDSGAPWGLEAANWYLPAMTARSGALLKDPRQWRRRFAALANVGFVVVDEGALPAGRTVENLIAREPALAVSAVAAPSVLPRAYLASPRCVSGPDEALRQLASEEFQPGVEAVVECREPLPAAAGPLGKAELVLHAPNRVVVEVSAEQSAVLVLSDPFAAGWSATLDGAPAEILPANHAFRGVAVGAGMHRIEFRYRPPLLGLGLFLTLAGLVLCVYFSSGRARVRGALQSSRAS